MVAWQKLWLLPGQLRHKFETPEVETTEPLASQQMGIREQDMHIVLDLLRNKLYRDPIRACVREYLCNARDAHREVGTPEKPVRVTLPTELARQSEFKDEGPGISPRRMGDIFLNRVASLRARAPGASAKRRRLGDLR